jgi:hypothetical protein
MITEHFVEVELVGETKVLGENLPKHQFDHHKFPLIWDRSLGVAVGRW